MTAKFEPGRIAASREVHDLFGSSPTFETWCMESLDRHLSGDWGDVPPEDAQANEQALKDGLRLLSHYKFPHSFPPVFAGQMFMESRSIFIITEADRSATTILFPAEY